MILDYTDEQLIERTLDGDDDAFAEIVRRWERRMFALCYGILGSAEDARDAVQETFINAFRNLKNFRGDAQASTWLHRIAVNACISRTRYKRSRPETEIEDETEAANSLVASGESPASRTERRERSEIVRQAVLSLPIELRQVVVMKEFEDMTFQEIAEALETPLSTIKSRLYTGLKQLRLRLAKLAPESDRQKKIENRLTLGAEITVGS